MSKWCVRLQQNLIKFATKRCKKSKPKIFILSLQRELSLIYYIALEMRREIFIILLRIPKNNACLISPLILIYDFYIYVRIKCIITLDESDFQSQPKFNKRKLNLNGIVFARCWYNSWWWCDDDVISIHLVAAKNTFLILQSTCHLKAEFVPTLTFYISEIVLSSCVWWWH